MHRAGITCKRVSAKHSVKDDHAFLWKHAIFGYLPSRNPSTDQDENLHDWLRRRAYLMCQKWFESVGWGRPHTWVKYNLKNFSISTLLYLFFSCMPLQTRRLNRFARTMAQTTRFAVRKCLLGVALIRNYISGSKPPKNPKFWNRNAKFPAKSIHSNNFWTVGDRRKISTDRLYKIGVGESNRDVISAAGRHLAVKTTSGLILKVLKSRITCERFEIDEKCQCNTNRKPMSGYRLVTLDVLRSST